jgi:hypothetical protein
MCGMDEDFRHSSKRVRRRRRHKTTVTNINVFALGGPADPARPEAGLPPALAAAEEEDFFGERLVSPEWLERRAKQLEKQERQLETRLGQKESELGTFVARVQGGLLADAG